MAAADLEDSDVNARRNVVVLSASIIFAWYLGLKVPVSVSFLSPDMPTEVLNIGKIWVALLVLLVYFVLRYHFMPSRKERWDEGKKCLAEVHKTWLAPWLRKRLAARFSKIFEPHEFRITYLGLHDWRNVEFQYEREHESQSDYKRRNQHGEDRMRLPVWLSVLNAAAGFVVRGLLSRDGLEVAVPYFLAGVAAYACIEKAGWIAWFFLWCSKSFSAAIF